MLSHKLGVATAGFRGVSHPQVICVDWLLFCGTYDDNDGGDDDDDDDGGDDDDDDDDDDDTWRWKTCIAVNDDIHIGIINDANNRWSSHDTCTTVW